MLKKLLERGGLVVILPVDHVVHQRHSVWRVRHLPGDQDVVKFFAYPEYREVTLLAPKFFSVIDVFLLSMVLYIFALGLYELFIGKLHVPPWLSIESVDELKAKLASVVILFVAIAYVKLLVEWQNPVDTLLFGAATGILIAVLIQYYKAKEGHGDAGGFLYGSTARSWRQNDRG